MGASGVVFVIDLQEAYDSRDMQEFRRLLDSKTEEALKGALRQVEEGSSL